MIIAFVSNPLNFFSLFALAENKKNTILVINTSIYPKNINKYLNIKRKYFGSKIYCLNFILSRAIIKIKFILKTILYINKLIYKINGLNLISIAVPTLIEKPLYYLYDDVFSSFKSLKIYEFGDNLGVKCSLKSLNKDHYAYETQKSLLLKRKRNLSSQLINSFLFERTEKKELLNTTSEGKNYLNSINSFIKNNKDLDLFIQNYIFKTPMKKKQNIYVLALRSVGRKENQSIFKKDELLSIKKNATLIIRPHPRDLICESTLIKNKLRKQLNTLKNILKELEIKNITFDKFSFIPIEILILHSLNNNYLIRIIGKDSGIVLNKNKK